MAIKKNINHLLTGLEVHFTVGSRIAPISERISRSCAQGRKSMIGNIAWGRTNSKKR